MNTIDCCAEENDCIVCAEDLISSKDTVTLKSCCRQRVHFKCFLECLKNNPICIFCRKEYLIEYLYIDRNQYIQKLENDTKNIYYNSQINPVESRNTKTIRAIHIRAK